MARRPVRPGPSHAPDYPEIRALSEQLEDARAREQKLQGAGIQTDEVRGEILELRRKLRDGGQLRAGADLADGRYVLVKPLGRGGFAVVWKAHDIVKNRSVAIKVLHHHLAGDRQRRERFFRGARVMTELAHAAVVHVLDPRGEDENFCYFVMELAAGGNLRDAILEKRVEPSRVLPLILQVCEALAEAHKRQLIHRDVKPANILLDEHGNAKLTDFDLVGAPDTTGGTRTGALGTVVYAAPECLDKPQEATARADVFGLGMTAIFCLSGHELSMTTFRNPEATVGRLNCSAPLQGVLARAVAWEPERRFPDAAAMVAALGRADQGQFLSDDAVFENATDLVVEGMSERQRKRRAVQLGVGAFVALAVGVGVSVSILTHNARDGLKVVINSEHNSVVTRRDSNTIEVVAATVGPESPRDASAGSGNAASLGSGSDMGAAGRYRGAKQPDEAVVIARKQEVVRCLQDGDNVPPGTRVHVVVAADGNVETVTVHPDAFGLTPSGSCIRMVFKVIRFPRESGGRDLLVHIRSDPTAERNAPADLERTGAPPR